MATKPEHSGASRQQGRSPAYPFFNVEKAIERARQLWDAERSHWAPLVSAMSAWNYSPKSSGGRQTLATMKYYALIEVAGEGMQRNVRLSELAKRILLDDREDDSERRQLIREVALSPSAHRAIYEKYKDEGRLPSDSTVEYFLVWDKGFNKDAARDLLAEFKETASIVSLFEPAEVLDKICEDDGPDKSSMKIGIGDLVQATVNGQHVFAQPAKVLGFSDDNVWVFTDQSRSAVKLEEVTLLQSAPNMHEERPKVPAALLSTEDARPAPGMRKAVFPVSDGDVSLIFPRGISAESLRELGMYLEIFLKRESAAAE